MSGRVDHGCYTDVEYLWFNCKPIVRYIRSFLGLLTWPVMVPLALVSRLSDGVFRTVSEVVSLIPYLFGMIARYEFYRFALTACGSNVCFEFGALVVYRDISIGSNVGIGRYVVVNHCDIGSYVLVSEGTSLLSGARHHNFERTDLPMALQGGKKTRIAIGDDCWIGARSVVMADVGGGSVIGAGSVVTKPVEPMTIVAGNPARPIRKRSLEGARN